MPKHVVNHSLRHELLVERDAVRKQRQDALRDIDAVAPGVSRVLGPALLGLEAGQTTFHYGQFDDKNMAIEVDSVATVDMPGDKDCTVILATAELPDNDSSAPITFSAARMLFEGFNPIDVRRQRNYADQS